MQELINRLQDMRNRIAALLERLDIAKREKEITDLETDSVKPDFWTDSNKARNIMQRIAAQKRIVERWRGLEKQGGDIADLITLATEEKDHALWDEIKADIDKMAVTLDELELELAFSGQYDARNAMVSIHAGAGGTESQDWAEMLMRMYLRWAEKRGYKTEVLDITRGEEVGVKSATISFNGDYAFGYLKSEHGVHRLVRLSPFDSDHARHTSFVLVEVMPEAEAGADVTINPDDLKIEAYRSSGAGGQNVQKTSTAIRITHVPSGLVVTCQTERSQHQNKEIAMRMLQSRLLEKELERQAEEKARLKGKRIEAGWGNQIRSYVLHPYRMVKDHRTDFETSNTDAVLSGEIDNFITAYLRYIAGRQDA
ncbi:MAG: peptide chain release factor 2 [Dehalococcoidales bacterium]|nr:peptide chain release factor 2 [Dehalococcoidales bacterium]